MKTFITLLMFMFVGTVGITAQQVVAPTPPVKVRVENLYDSQRTVKGAPFSAVSTSENVQMLADGNRIVRRSSSKLFRDSEGRYRREDMPKTLGLANVQVDVPESIVILDPVAGFTYSLNPKTNTARRNQFRRVYIYSTRPDAQMKLQTELDNAKVYTLKENAAKEKELVEAEKATTMDPERAKEIAARQAERAKEIAARQAERANMIAERQAEMETRVIARAGALTIAAPYAGSSKYETKTESLGVQNIEGVEAEGTRSTTTIPAGEIGNERPIEIVYEKWYSKDLQMIVMSRHSDPRSGEQVYRLTDIRREEPPSNLFLPGPEYKIVDAGTPKVSTTVMSPPTVTARPATVVKYSPTPTTAPKPPAPPKKSNEQ